MRLGTSALPGKYSTENPTWASYLFAPRIFTNPRYGYGPYSDGIFTQSNCGIVTEMGIWLVLKTEVYTYATSFQNDEDYAAIMDTVQPLIL